MSLVQTRDKVNKDAGREGGDDTMKTLLLALHSVCCGMGGDGGEERRMRTCLRS
jgi:hypothetical protein